MSLALLLTMSTGEIPEGDHILSQFCGNPQASEWAQTPAGPGGSLASGLHGPQSRLFLQRPPEQAPPPPGSL